MRCFWFARISKDANNRERLIHAYCSLNHHAQEPIHCRVKYEFGSVTVENEGLSSLYG